MQDERRGDRVGFVGERAGQPGDGLLWRKRLLRQPALGAQAGEQIGRASCGERV